MFALVLFGCLIVPSFQLLFLNIPQPQVDPDVFRDTCSIAIAKGYQCDNHTVTTADGYILAIHRLYRTGGPAIKPVVFLQHGFEDSSVTWVINMQSQSLGFLAADQGMDVWLGNVRGNVYCRTHTTFTNIPYYNAFAPSAFWNFTFNEMAKQDLPSMVQYVLNVTGAPNLYYVGHSQGSMIGFIQFSEDPTWAQSRIKQFHAMAPVAWQGNTKCLLKVLQPLDPLMSLYPTMADTEFTPDNPFAAPLSLGTILCPPLVSNLLCTNWAMLFTGSTMDKENATRNAVYFAKIPSGTSTLNILHYERLISSKKFETYGPNPVQYHPNTSLVPVYLYWSENDACTQPADVDILKQNLNTVVYEHKQNDYDHMDFVWSLTAAQDIYGNILNTIQTDFNASP